MSTFLDEDVVQEEVTVVEVSVTAPPATPPGAPTARPTPPGNPVLARLLRMADGYRRSGALHQSMELYFELVEQHGDALEAVQARERLLAICDQYEREGKMRQARSLYERLV